MGTAVQMVIDEAFHGSDRRYARLLPGKTSKGWLCFSLTREVGVGYAVDAAKEGAISYLHRVRLNLDDVMEVECGGAHWSEVPCPWSGEEREIDGVAREAIAAGYSSVLFRDVQDAVDTSDGALSTTVFVTRPDQIELLEIVEVQPDCSPVSLQSCISSLPSS